MKELTIISKQLPVLEVNFAEVKEDLKKSVEEYKNLVVTEQTLAACKSQQGELASLRIKIDKYRLDIKKDLTKPITEFENKCKELLEVVEEAEKPLKESIQVFDNKKKDENKAKAKEIIDAVVIEKGLAKKYADQLTVLEKYGKLTAKISEVKEDIEQRAFILLGQQQQEEERLELIKDAIENANKEINAKMSIADFQRLIDSGASTKDIIKDINARSERIKIAETPKVEEPAPIEEPQSLQTPVENIVQGYPCTISIQQIPVNEPVKPVEETKAQNNVFTVMLEINGNTAQLESLKPYIQGKGMGYAVTKVLLQIQGTKGNLEELKPFIENNGMSYTRRKDLE